MKSYTPIACSLYDYFELLILKKQEVIITTYEESFQTILTNIYAEKGVEYLELKNENRIRLDAIIEINNLKTNEFINCKI